MNTKLTKKLTYKYLNIQLVHIALIMSCNL